MNSLNSIFKPITETVAKWPLQQIIIISLIAVIGFLVAKLISTIAGKQVEKKMDSTSGLIARKVSFYLLLLLVGAVILRELEVSIGALVAAGGFLGLAIGFAAQTSVSNIISGIFLISERPFNVGDVIKIEGNVGIVLSIDLLSTKLRNFENLFWRVPNEKVLKSDIITITKYDIRRMDIVTSISYDDDIQKARDILLECADNNHLVLGDPEPIVLVTKMGDSGIEMTLRCWFYKTDYLALLTELTHEAKLALEEAGCTIPYPHHTVYVRNEKDWEQAGKLEKE